MHVLFPLVYSVYDAGESITGPNRGLNPALVPRRCQFQRPGEVATQKDRLLGWPSAAVDRMQTCLQRRRERLHLREYNKAGLFVFVSVCVCCMSGAA